MEKEEVEKLVKEHESEIWKLDLHISYCKERHHALAEQIPKAHWTERGDIGKEACWWWDHITFLECKKAGLEPDKWELERIRYVTNPVSALKYLRSNENLRRMQE